MSHASRALLAACLLALAACGGDDAPEADALIGTWALVDSYNEVFDYGFVGTSEANT